MKTCDQCKFWTPEDLQFSHRFPEISAKYKDQGDCAMFGDVNNFNDGPASRNDVCYGSDYESYKASVVVMAKFGCIHWEKKND
jgi:hypothetical protein